MDDLTPDQWQAEEDWHHAQVEAGHSIAALIDGFRGTDTGNAERFAAIAEGRARYVADWGKWIVYEDGRWRLDPGDALVTELAKDVPRTMFRFAAGAEGSGRDDLWKWAKRSEAGAQIAGMVRLARGIPGIRTDSNDLDADPWALNVANGTVDLRTGKLRRHNPDDLITRRAPFAYDPTARGPRWEAFLERILPGHDLRRFVQRAAGYSTTGDVSEQVLILAIGDGANGKSTFVDAVQHTLGDYAGTVAKDLLIAQRHEAHPTSAADLFRLRFATAVETEATNRLAEARVKNLTGGDQIKARRMREDFWSFTPSHKLWLFANHLPRISGTDHGIWRRIRVVPFSVVIPEAERDRDLPAALADEAPAILAWLIEGARDWLDTGLEPPPEVVAATEQYRVASDWFANWIEDHNLELGPVSELRILTSELARSYRDWALANGEEPLSRQDLAKELERRGCRPKKVQSARFWTGIARREGAE